MASETDIKSFEGRIRSEEEYALAYLKSHEYEKLLASAGRLLSLKGGLEEARYQMEAADLARQGER